MLRVLIDTCVWLDMAKDYRHRPTLAALEQLVEAKEVSFILPCQAVDEFARNKDRIIRESGRSLSSTFKRVKEAVRQFGKTDGKNEALATLDDIDHRITILGEASGIPSFLATTAGLMFADDHSAKHSQVAVTDRGSGTSLGQIGALPAERHQHGRLWQLESVLAGQTHQA